MHMHERMNVSFKKETIMKQNTHPNLSAGLQPAAGPAAAALGLSAGLEVSRAGSVLVLRGAPDAGPRGLPAPASRRCGLAPGPPLLRPPEPGPEVARILAPCMGLRCDAVSPMAAAPSAALRM